jgi:hypothetical protein
VVLVAALFLVAAMLAIIGCGSNSDKSDKFVGTWLQPQEVLPSSEPSTPLTIKKVGDEYTLTGPGGVAYAQAISRNGEKAGTSDLYGMILDKGAKAAKDGDMLKLPVGKGTVSISVSGDTLTILTQDGGDGYIFSRVKS